ncbi:MAG TPA: phosphoribosyltransferase family protein [Pyrinomonadaceae bacterium]|nr:phosphoribosyltransferase family protein [Pyrinomonadaceae bacterium]
MNEQIEEVYGPAEIAERVRALGEEISEAYRGRELTVLGVLEDSFVFLADLLRALGHVPLRTSFLRYDHRARGGLQDLTFSTDIEIKGRDVLLVEGVLNTGIPQDYLVRQLVEARGASSVRLCVLVDKPDGRRTDLRPDWRAFETREDYVVGYGLGFQERWRELPGIAAVRRA